MEIKNIVLLVIFVLGLVYMQLIQAQTVDEIINKYAEARGGKNKLNSITSVYMEGSRQMMGNKVAIKVTKVQGKLYRNDFEFGANKGYTIVTPSAGWSFIPMRSQKAEVIAEGRLKTMQADMDIADPLIEYKAKGYKAELAGKENIDGKDAYKIKLIVSAGKEITYFVDTENYLVIQTRQMRTGMGGNEEEREVITNYADYKPVDGIMFPHTVSNPGEGLVAGAITFDKIELNKPIEESE
ncbi:MAG: hypothetical protein ABIN97_09635, partial [Ginsengibacter sp.]